MHEMLVAVGEWEAEPVVDRNRLASVIQQPVPQQQQEDDAAMASRRGRSAYAAPVSTAPPDAEPVHDASEFVFVKRDGGLLFAVAFSVQSGQLNYITHEGIQRTVPLAALDADATRRMNEERGTLIRLPA